MAAQVAPRSRWTWWKLSQGDVDWFGLFEGAPEEFRQVKALSAVGTPRRMSVGTIARASTTFTITRCTRPSVNSRYRRPLPAGRIAKRLMLLDGVLANPELNWLVTAAEKVTYFTTLPCPVRVEKLPRPTMTAGSTAVGDPFPDGLPIGIDASGRAVFLYLVLPTARDDFRAFLGRYVELFRTLHFWTLRLVFPRPIAHSYTGSRRSSVTNWKARYWPVRSMN